MEDHLVGLSDEEVDKAIRWRILNDPVKSFYFKLGAMDAARLQLTDDHELCETQVAELTTVLADLVRSKSFDMLPRLLQDRVKTAIKTRGIVMAR